MKCMIEYVRRIPCSEYIAAADNSQEYRKYRSIPDGKGEEYGKVHTFENGKKMRVVPSLERCNGQHNDPDENEGLFPSGNDRKADLLPDCKNDTGVELLFEV